MTVIAFAAGLLAFVAACVAPVVAQDPQADATAEHLPMHRLQLPGNPYIWSAAFAADGERLFIHVNGQAVNVWAILVYYWPELLGALTAATGLFCSIVLLRITRRKRIVGAPHCRRCNYCLTGCTSGRCPECGTAVDRPIRGRPMCLRTLPFALPLVVTVAGYGSLWMLRAPRSGYVTTRVNWWSYELHDWARDKGVSLTSWLAWVDRILEIDVESGRTLRTLITRPNRQTSPCPLTVTPDGTALLMTIDDGDRLALVNTGSGSVMRTLSYGDFASVGISRWNQIAGFDEGGRTAYVVLLDTPEKKTVLLAWNLQSGESSKLLEVDADRVRLRQGPDGVRPRQFYRAPGPNPGRFLEMPAEMAAGRDSTPTEFIVRDGMDLQRIVSSFSQAMRRFSGPSFTSDGRQVYLHPKSLGTFEDTFASYELDTGRPLPPLPVPPFYVLSSKSAAIPLRGWVVIGGGWLSQQTKKPFSSTSMGFLVGDLNHRRWIGRFTQPSDGSYYNVVASPDGRFFATDGYLKNSSGAGGRYQNELLIYDLRSLPHDFPDRRQLSPAGANE